MYHFALRFISFGVTGRLSSLNVCLMCRLSKCEEGKKIWTTLHFDGSEGCGEEIINGHVLVKLGRSPLCMCQYGWIHRRACVCVRKCTSL